MCLGAVLSRRVPGLSGDRGGSMGIEQQVYIKSDRRGRGLILVFCLAPVIVPLLTIGGKFALEEPLVSEWAQVTRIFTSSAQASAPMPIPANLGSLPRREDFQSSIIFAAPSHAAQDFRWLNGQTSVEQTASASELAPTALALRRDN